MQLLRSQFDTLNGVPSMRRGRMTPSHSTPVFGDRKAALLRLCARVGYTPHANL